MDIGSSLKIAVALFGADSKNSPASRQFQTSIDRLANNAASGDHEAVEALLNLCAGPRNSALSKAAVAAVMRLYRRPETLMSVRQAIGSQAARLCETFIVAKDQLHKKNPKTQPAPVDVPAALLYVGGQHAHEKRHTNLENQINAELRDVCFPQALEGSEDRDLLTLGRLVRAEELQCVTKALTELPVHRHCLELSPPSGPPFAKRLAQVLREVDSDGKPRAVFVNVQNHWVTLVLCPKADEWSATVDVLLIDTHRKDPDHLGRSINEAVQTALGQRLGEFRLSGGAMQTNTPNACGPLATLTMWSLNVHLNQNPETNFDGLCSETHRWVNVWQELSSEQQNAMVTAQRAALLSSLQQ